MSDLPILNKLRQGPQLIGEDKHVVLSSSSCPDLIRGVNEHLRDGWQLAGGICVAAELIEGDGMQCSHDSFRFSQAMWRR